MSMYRLGFLLPLVFACAPEGPVEDADTADTTVDDLTTLPSCGNGIVEGLEVCDDGSDNSDTTAGACRTTCQAAYCGDAVVDTEESCDDGNHLGGDGCDPACLPEPGPFEVEPNDVPFTATPLVGGESVAGGLADGDIDCFAITVPDNAWILARVTGPDGTCPPETVLRYYDRDGDELVTVFPEAPDVCVDIDPNDHEEASFLDAGTYTVCVEGVLRTAVPAYRLTVVVGDDSCLGGLVPDPKDDPDGDGLANACDPDDDGDFVPDAEDNCPRTRNGGGASGLVTPTEGWIRQWLVTDGIRDTSVGSLGGCHPSEAPYLDASDDASVLPVLGDAAADQAWRAYFLPAGENSIDFRDVTSTSPHHEVYAASWFRLDSAEEVVVAYGSDDGSRLWVDDQMLVDDGECHGVVTDDFTAQISLEAGWHRVMVKVRDHGGGFGLRLRLKRPSGAPMGGVEISLAPRSWIDDQTDTDGDGKGDVCDPDPSRP